MSNSKEEKNNFDFFDLKNYDLYTKIEEDFVIQTSGGATLSFIGWFIIIVLVFSEFSCYVKKSTKEHMVVDTTLGEHLRINIDITFHAITCAEVNVDAMDVAGDNQIGISHDMYKQRLDPKGQPLGEKGAEIIGTLDKIEPLPPNYCGSCYGAETVFRECCNSCDDLKHAYAAKGWALNSNIQNSEQCMRDKTNPFAVIRNGEGCRVHGSMTVNKVAGNFHIAHGESIVRDGRHIHQFIPSEAPFFNISHTIHSLSFGKPYPSMPKSPLDNRKKVIEPDVGTGLHQYFIKILPTVFKDSGNSVLSTNQFSYSEKFRPIKTLDPSSGMETMVLF